MIYFLFHHDRWDDQYLIKELGEENVRCIYSHDYQQWYMRHWRHFGGSLKAVRASKKGDTIVAWHYLQAVLAWWICKLTFRKRQFVSLNILLKKDKTLKNKLHRYLCKKAFQAKNFRATVTSVPYGKWLNKQLGIDVEYPLLHDVYHDYYCTPQYSEGKNKDIVFCGGASGRDWELMLDIIRITPELKFYMVMPKHIFRPFMKKHGDDLPQNVKIGCNMPYKEFMFRLCQSTLVVLPLSINAPAGLTVMYQAAANRRMVLTSDTEAMKEYFMPYQLCGKNPEQWRDKIRYYLQHEDERKAEADRFHDFITTQCTETDYARIVAQVCKELTPDKS